MRQPMAAVAAVLLVVAAHPVAAAPQEELEEAEQELEATVESLQQARDTYEQAQQRLAALRVELGDVRSRLDQARAAAQQLGRREREARERARRASRRRERRQRRLSSLVTDTYQHGVSASADLWLATLSGARTAHDIARVQWTTRRLTEQNDELADTAKQAARDARAAEQEAEQAAEQAAERRREVQSLVARQRDLVEEAEAERAEQQAVIDELAADEQAQQELVAELERQLDSVEAVLREPRQVPFDQPTPGWASGLPSAGYGWAGEVDAAAARAGVDGRFFAALVWTESYFRPGAVSPAGAIGLAQLMPGTAELMGVDPHDPIQNLTGGARYLRQQLEKFRDVELGLAAYNAGPGEVSAAGGVPNIVETRLYVLAVVERWRSL